MSEVTIYVYVLKSESYDRKYVGMTSDLENRIKEHNSGKTKSTKGYVPWRLVYHEEFDSYESARKREKYFKTAAGRRFLKKKGV